MTTRLRPDTETDTPLLTDWLTYKEAAAYCRISLRTLHRHLKRPDCPFRPKLVMGRNPRISRKRLDAALAKMPTLPCRKSVGKDHLKVETVAAPVLGFMGLGEEGGKSSC